MQYPPKLNILFMQTNEPILLIEGEAEITLSEFLNIPENRNGLTDDEITAIKNLQVGETWQHSFSGFNAQRIR
jgi:hypothetical protein